MLVLGREIKGRVIIEVPPSQTAARITTTLCDIRGDKVRLGFDAPPVVLIHRSEVMDEIDAERAAKSAAKGGASG